MLMHLEKGTSIVGISLGQERIFRLTRYGKTKEFNLNSGSMYAMHPPTNDYWCHEIVKDTSTKPRISLTFRDYSGGN